MQLLNVNYWIIDAFMFTTAGQCGLNYLLLDILTYYMSMFFLQVDILYYLKSGVKSTKCIRNSGIEV